jgi:mannitol 2-dehydrogenase
VGATLTASVHDYESMKLRILNAGHQVLANAGELLGLETISDCMANPLLAAFFAKVQREDIAPHVSAVPGMSAQDYVDLVVRRFSNPKIRDTTRRVAFDGSSRHPGFVLLSLRDGLAANGSVDGLALVEAIWARMCAGSREDGSTIEPNDPFWDALCAKANEAKITPSAWLDMSQIYGALREDSRFVGSFAHWLSMIWDEGLEAAIRTYLK